MDSLKSKLDTVLRPVSARLRKSPSKPKNQLPVIPNRRRVNKTGVRMQQDTVAIAENREYAEVKEHVMKE